MALILNPRQTLKKQGQQAQRRAKTKRLYGRIVNAFEIRQTGPKVRVFRERHRVQIERNANSLLEHERAGSAISLQIRDRKTRPDCQDKLSNFPYLQKPEQRSKAG